MKLYIVYTYRTFNRLEEKINFIRIIFSSTITTTTAFVRQRNKNNMILFYVRFPLTLPLSLTIAHRT